MKTNSITFGQTYLTSSLKYMSEDNRKKLSKLYPLGEIYPVDVYLGSNKKGDLTLTITQSSLYDYLILNNKIKLTPETIAVVNVIKKAHNTYNYVHGFNQPVKRATIPYLDYIPEDILPYYVAEEIEDYARENYKNFYN